MKRILVIGEHSYIGTSFRDYMAEHEPDALVKLAGSRNGEWEKEDFKLYDAVLHAAAVVHKKERPEMKKLYYEVNAKLPYEAAKKAKKNGTRQFLFLSTMAVYGEGRETIGKDTPVCPATMYAKSKRRAEQALEKLSDGTFRVTVFRPPMVYGPKCPGNYKKLSKLAAYLPVFPKADNERSMIYIDNLCECIRQEILDSEKGDLSGRSYRIRCPQNAEYVNTSELVKEIRAAHGKRTCLLPFFHRTLQAFSGKIGILKKIFGNCHYEKEESIRTYQKTGFRKSIRQTEGIR